jgi:phosphoserine aminotransferase
MSIANFYPGPSRVYANVPSYLNDAYAEGFLSCNHRSALFMGMMAETKAILHEKLLIPADYEVAFVSSATECWEIITQSLTVKGSFHLYNGAFGEKWHEYAAKLTTTKSVSFGVNDVLPVQEVGGDFDVIAVTQNETSNGTEVRNETLKALRDANPDQLIAVDATSSLGGVKLDFENADVWYASVQKCFGLPAGFGIMILSPKAIAKAFEINENRHYNSLVSIIENTRKNQTHYTPNVMGIYLLNRTQKDANGVDFISEKTQLKANYYQEVIKNVAGFEYLVENESVRSRTVLALKHADPQAVLADAAEYGITLGAGYGAWKKSTLRIANFPAILVKEVQMLVAYLEK